MARVDYEEMASSYDAGRDHPRERRGDRRRALAASVDRGRPLLDLGTGTGQWSGLLADWFGVDVVAVEPSLEMRIRAVSRSDSRVHVVAGTGESRRPPQVRTCQLKCGPAGEGDHRPPPCRLGHAAVAGGRLDGLVAGDTGWVGARPPLSAAYFDGWYAQMARFPAKDEIQQRHLGLPAHVPSTSSLTGAGIGEVSAALRLAPGGTLLDLACGRGGYGLEIAARTGARLIGVDFSAEAVRQASSLARQLGRQADFRVGDLTATGLGAGSVDAVLCVDSIQFATPPAAAYAEISRVLVPGGRVVLTGWEPVDRGDPRLVSRLQDVDTRAGLHSAGFDEVEVHERPDWRQTERHMWEEAATVDPGDDPALQSLHNEAVRVLDTFPLVCRVLATATAP